MVDIKDHPQIMDAINTIVSNGGIAEIKLEKGKTITVVEIVRKVKSKSL